MENLSDIQILCQNIKSLRQKHNLSKKEMSKILGIGMKTLNQIENGILPPRMSCEPLFRIQSHFGIRPQQLFSILP